MESEVFLEWTDYSGLLPNLVVKPSMCDVTTLTYYVIFVTYIRMREVGAAPAVMIPSD